MTVGEYRQILVSVEPPFAEVDLQYRSEDESVAVVDAFGVVHAVGKGTTQVSIWDT